MIAYVIYCNNDLLRLLLQDDKAAFTELYSRYWKELFAIVFSPVSFTKVFEPELTDEVKFKIEGRKIIFSP